MQSNDGDVLRFHIYKRQYEVVRKKRDDEDEIIKCKGRNGIIVSDHNLFRDNTNHGCYYKCLCGGSL